jgi:hypothetical protein
MKYLVCNEGNTSDFQVLTKDELDESLRSNEFDGKYTKAYELGKEFTLKTVQIMEEVDNDPRNEPPLY